MDQHELLLVKEEEKEHFCEKCGENLKITKPVFKFDSMGGWQYLYKATFTCPNRKHFWDGHDHFTASRSSWGVQ